MFKSKDVEKKIEKELEKALKPEKELKIEIKEKPEKRELKEFKEFPDKLWKEKEIEKIKPEKEYLEKFQKDIEKVKPEKEFEKAVVEGQQDPTTSIFKGTGNPEDRLRELEDAVTKLSHFIGVDLRPDLTTGALKGEPDVSGEGTGGKAKPDAKKRPK